MPVDIPSQSKPKTWRLLCVWGLFLATFPAGVVAGLLMAHGQDAAGSGIGLALGMLGVGLIGGIGTGVFASILTIRRLPGLAGWLLASLLWIILAALWWTALFTPTGDHFAEWLQK